MGKDLRNKELGLGIIQRKDGLYMARFTSKSGKRISLTDHDLKYLKIRIDKVKRSRYEFDCPRLSAHIFRHTFATRCLEAEFSFGTWDNLHDTVLCS